MTEPTLASGASERLRDWVLARHPAALDDPEFVAGLLAVVADEVARAVREACWRHRRLAGPACGP